MIFSRMRALVGALCLFLTTAYAGPLSVSNGLFVKDGKPFYGVGVNYFDAFQRYVINGDMSAISKLSTLKQYHVPFIRINTIGFWPTDIQQHYMNNNGQFISRLQTFMDAAQAQGIGVVLDLFWNWDAYADINGEHMPAWGDPNSATRQYMRAQTAFLVGKFKDHPALWAWEFANESTGIIDIPASVGNYHWVPSGGPSVGSPARTVADNIVPSTIISALADFATTVRQVDPNTPIFSGNSPPYYCAYNMQQSGSWKPDTPQQFGMILLRNEPAPINTLSMHLYPDQEGTSGKYFTQPSTATFNDILAAAMAESVIANRPFFLGEFGVNTATLGASGAMDKFNQMTDSIMNNRVQMSSLWVFDLAQQATTYSVTTSVSEYQLEKVSSMNQTMAGW